MARELVVETTDYHTAGEPFRIVTDGVGPLGGLTILDKRRYAAEHLDHIRGEVDRSPCGSGTSARLALLDSAGELPRGEMLTRLSVIGTMFSGRVVEETEVAGRPAVITEVEGGAHLIGHHRFVLREEDPVGSGFLLR